MQLFGHQHLWKPPFMETSILWINAIMIHIYIYTQSLIRNLPNISISSCWSKMVVEQRQWYSKKYIYIYICIYPSINHQYLSIYQPNISWLKLTIDSCWLQKNTYRFMFVRTRSGACGTTRRDMSCLGRMGRLRLDGGGRQPPKQPEKTWYIIA